MTGQVILAVLGTAATIIGTAIAVARFLGARLDDMHRWIDDTNNNVGKQFDDFGKRFDDFGKRFDDAREENKVAHAGIVERIESVNKRLDKVIDGK